MSRRPFRDEMDVVVPMKDRIALVDKPAGGTRLLPVYRVVPTCAFEPMDLQAARRFLDCAKEPLGDGMMVPETARR